MQVVSEPLKIVNYPHPSLRYKAAPLTSVDARLVRIAEAMFDLMDEHKGLGLAGPQVGLPFRLFVARIPLDPANPEKPSAFLNPVVCETEGGITDEEGCLSFPGLYAKVHRARNVVVQAYDLTGELRTLKLSNLFARLWQHETDHLDGKLFIDKVSQVGRLAVRGPVGEFERTYSRAQKKGEIPPDDELLRLLRELEKAGPPDVPVPQPQEKPCASS